MSVLERPCERELYEQIWTHDVYRQVSPGEAAAQRFLQVAQPPKGAQVLDLGCGTGRGGLALALFGGLNVTLIDFASNCLDADIAPMLTTQAHALRFVQADLTESLPIAAPYGFCCDVLEHIPPEQVGSVLDNCLHAAQHCFFQIATTPDVMGKLVGHPLHLTVRPYEWWLARLTERGCVIHWSHNEEGQDGHHLGRCAFYVTAWTTGQEIVEVGVLNIAEEKVIENVRVNTAGGWQQVTPHETNNVDVMIVGGGPSAKESVQEICSLRAAGVKLVTLNGAYNWAMQQGLTPSAQIVVDARPFNARFTRPVVPDCKYLIASQVDPSVLEGLPPERTYLWHTSTEAIREILLAAYPVSFPVPGGSTVLLRAIPLLRMLGFKRFICFGTDSCLIANEHHSYEQRENSEELVIPVHVGGRMFQCHAWMIAQCQEMLELIKFLGDEIQLDIKGSGLLAWVLQHGYDLAKADENAKRRQRRAQKHEDSLGTHSR